MRECCQEGECAILKDFDERIERLGKEIAELKETHKNNRESDRGQINANLRGIRFWRKTCLTIEKAINELKDQLEDLPNYPDVNILEGDIMQIDHDCKTNREVLLILSKTIDKYLDTQGLEKTEPIRLELRNLSLKLSGKKDKKHSIQVGLIPQKSDDIPLKPDQLKYYDLGMVFSNEEGILEEYVPSQFVKDFAKKYSAFNLTGFMNPESEERKKSQEKPVKLTDPSKVDKTLGDPEHLYEIEEKSKEPDWMITKPLGPLIDTRPEKCKICNFDYYEDCQEGCKISKISNNEKIDEGR